MLYNFIYVLPNIKYGKCKPLRMLPHIAHKVSTRVGTTFSFVIPLTGRYVSSRATAKIIQRNVLISKTP